MSRHTNSILAVFLVLAALWTAPASAVSGDGVSRPKPEYHQTNVAARRRAAASGTRSAYTGDSDVYWAENNRMRLYFHTRYSDEWYFSWNGSEAETSFRENFALWFDGRTSYGAHEWGEDGDTTTVKLFGGGRNDEDNSCILDFRNALRVERSIRIAPGDGTYFKVCYKVTNITDQPIADVRFFELVDFDIPWTGEHGDDIGWYDSLTDFVWVKDESWFQNGFTGNRPSSHHSVNQYYYVIFEDAGDGVLDDNAESSYNDPGIGLQWDAGTLQPGQTWDLDVTFWFGQPNSLFAVAGPDRTARVGETVHFDGGASYASQGAITAYEWDLDGDGDYGDASGVTADRVYDTPGTRSVVLRVSDDRGNMAYDECRVTVLPEMYRDTAVTARIPIGGLDTDADSATAPHSASEEDGSLLIRWQPGPMNVGMRKSFSYVTEVLAPVAGERRMVEEDCVVEYLDATGAGEPLPVSFSLGPAYVDVASGFGVAVSADKDEYLPPETVRLTTTVEVPAATATAEFAGRERLRDAAVSGADLDSVPGVAVVSAGSVSAELSFIVEAPASAVWRDLSFEAACPDGASVEVRTRGAATRRGLESAAFSEPSGISGAPVTSPQGRFLEARVTLLPNASGASPEFRSLSVSYATGGHRAVVRLVSPSGRTLDVASHDIPVSGCGGTSVFTDRWPSAGAESGEWRAVAELLGPVAADGVLASAADDFRILQEGLETIVSCSISPDRPRYCPGDTAALSAIVSNGSLRDTVSDLSATVTVIDPAGGEVLRETYLTGDIRAASADRRGFGLAVTPAMRTGTYTATLSVDANGGQVASSTATFLVVAEAEEGRGVSGSLSAAPQEVLRRTGTLVLHGEAVNTGASALAQVAPVVRIHSMGGEYVSGEYRETASLQPGAPHTMTPWEVSGITLAPGVYPASLTAELTAPSGRAVEIPLDCTGFEVVNLAPVADFGGPRTVEAASATANPVTLSAAASSDANSTDADGRDDIVSYSWTVDGEQAGTGMERTFMLALGSHEVTLAATDSCGAVGTATASILVTDTVPPVIGGLMPGNGSFVNGLEVAATLHDAVSGVDWTTVDLRAGGSPLETAADQASGRVTASLPSGTEDGWVSLALSVRDLCGNASSAPEWRICIDRTPPAFALEAPAEDAFAPGAGAAISVDVSDALSGVVPASVRLRVDGDEIAAVFDPATGLATGFLPEGLEDGWHQVSASATDAAGNAGEAVWTIGLDLTPPVFTQMSPGGDEPLAAADQTVSVVVEDAQSGVAPGSLSMTLDGNPVQAAFDPATGLLSFGAAGLADGVHTAWAQASDLAGNTSDVTWQFSVSVAVPSSEYLLFHNSQTGRLDITGGSTTISGMVHSHADIRVRGNGTVVTGSTTAVGDISVLGSGHDIALQQSQASPAPMPVYPFSHYEANADHVVNGNLAAGGGDALQPGVWLVYGDVTVTGNLDAAVTIVATGDIRVRGQVVRIENADPRHHVALYSRDGDISFAAHGSSVSGVVYAPSGECRVSSNGSTFAGGIVGDTIDISGQNVAIGPLGP